MVVWLAYARWPHVAAVGPAVYDGYLYGFFVVELLAGLRFDSTLPSLSHFPRLPTDALHLLVLFRQAQISASVGVVFAAMARIFYHDCGRGIQFLVGPCGWRIDVCARGSAVGPWELHTPVGALRFLVRPALLAHL